MSYWDLSDLRTRSGASFSFAELPDWKFDLLPANDWNPRYHRAVKRALMQPEALALQKRKAADGYVPTDEDAEIEARMYRAPGRRGVPFACRGDHAVRHDAGELRTP